MEKDKPSLTGRLKQYAQKAGQHVLRKGSTGKAPDQQAPTKTPEKSTPTKPAVSIPKSEKGSVEVDSVKHPRQNSVPYRGDITENVNARMQRHNTNEINQDNMAAFTRKVDAMVKNGIPKDQHAAPQVATHQTQKTIQKPDSMSRTQTLASQTKAVDRKQEKQSGKSQGPDKSSEKNQERNIKMQEHQKQHMQSPTRDNSPDR